MANNEDRIDRLEGRMTQAEIAISRIDSEAASHNKWSADKSEAIHTTLMRHGEKFEAIETWRYDLYAKIGELRWGRGQVLVIGGVVVAVVSAVLSAVVKKYTGLD